MRCELNKLLSPLSTHFFKCNTLPKKIFSIAEKNIRCTNRTSCIFFFIRRVGCVRKKKTNGRFSERATNKYLAICNKYYNVITWLDNETLIAVFA